MTTVPVHLTLNQLRVAAKSISRSIDVAARKLGRSRSGTPVYIDAQEEYRLLDDVDAALRTAMRGLIDDLVDEAQERSYEERLQ